MNPLKEFNQNIYVLILIVNYTFWKLSSLKLLRKHNMNRNKFPSNARDSLNLKRRVDRRKFLKFLKNIQKMCSYRILIEKVYAAVLCEISILVSKIFDRKSFKHVNIENSFSVRYITNINSADVKIGAVNIGTIV